MSNETKIKIIVDSGCDLSPELAKQESMYLEKVPLHIQVEDKKFIDDGSCDANIYLDAMESSPEIPKTAAPSPEAYLNHFEGNESIFVVTLSSKLSSSYNSAILAKNMYIETIGNKFIHVIDSLSASVGEVVIALKINELAKNGLTNFEIVESINKFIANMRTFFILEKTDNLAKTGRMNPYIAKLASILSIKPICKATGEGTIGLADKARGYKKAASRLIEIIANEPLDFENRILAIGHAQCPQRALDFKNEIKDKVPFKDIIITDLGLLCSTYASRHGIVIAY